MAKTLTKAQSYEDLKAYLEGTYTQYGSTYGDLIAFIDKELEVLVNKEKSRKATETHLENETYKDMILDYLSWHDQATCVEMIQNIDTFREQMLSNQRVSAICRAMVAEGTIEKSMVAGETLFSLAKD